MNMNENIEKNTEHNAQTKAGFVADLLNTFVKYFKWIALAIVLVILVSGIRTVQQGEVAVILRFGKLYGETREEQIHEPGLLFAFPYIIDEVVTVPTGKVFQLDVNTHYTEGEMSELVEENGYCITGDRNVAIISTSVKYSISDPIDYALYNADISSTVRGVVSASITKHVASVKIDTLLTDGKDDFIREVLADAQDVLDRLSCGVKLTNLDIGSIAPPVEVKTLFDQVSSATVDQKTKLAEAEQYSISAKNNAESKKTSIISDAYISQNEAVVEAERLLAEFNGLLKDFDPNGENKKVPDEIILRVYNEKLAQLYAKIGDKIIVDKTEAPATS